jgi:ABC-2 type transport system permease protein
VGLVDQDGGSTLSIHLSDLLEASDTIRPVALEEAIEKVEEKVSDEELAGAVIIPAGYTEHTLAGRDIALTVIVDAGSSGGSTAQRSIQTAIIRLCGAVQTARLSAEAFEAQGGLPDDAYLADALDRAIEAWREPTLTIAAARSGMAVATEEESTEPQVYDTPYAHASPGMMIQFSITGIMGAAQIIVLERKSRSMARMLTTAISRIEIILGHYLAMFITIFLQLALLIGFGQLVLGLDYMRDPVAILLVAVTMSLWTAGLGLLIGVLAKTEEQVIMYCMIPMFILSALGGAWMPLDITGKAFQTIGHLLPTAWGMDGLQNIIVRGLGLESVLLPSGIMLAYAIVLFAVAAWRFRFE